MKYDIKILLFTSHLFYQFANSQYISVDNSFSATALVQEKLINSPCISVFNVSSLGGNFGTNEKSIGYFEGNFSSFPFENGLILSTGKITNAVGPNSSLSDDGGSMNWDGDTDLNNALGLSNTFNASVLEFDFIPFGTKISFDYIFSSEQYLTNPSPNQCNYTDGFVFLLKAENETNYQNLAIIPNTEIPVKVNTVRGAGTLCPPANANYFDAFNTTEHPTNFNGQTKILTAQASVIPGVTYHIKIAIADEGNYRYDSALFLKGSSFDFGIDLGANKLISNGKALCPESTLTLNALQNGAISYQWFRNDELLINATNSTFEVTEPGVYRVDVQYLTNCEAKGEITIEYLLELVWSSTTYKKCDDDSNQDGLTTFNLEDVKNQLISSNINDLEFAFFESESSSIPLPQFYTNTIAFQQTVWLRVTNYDCFEAIPIQLISAVFEGNTTTENKNICDAESIILDTDGGFSNYLWNTNPAQNTSAITVSTPGIYEVILTNTEGCSATKKFIVSALTSPVIASLEINEFSTNNQVKIILNNSNSEDYIFSLDGIHFQNSAVFSQLSAGNYTAFVQHKKGCKLTKIAFTILDFPKFFTPNQDGFNDYWNISNLKNTQISIFDRYGKLVIQISSESQGWNGEINGKKLPSEDYWFMFTNSNGKIVKNHFSLKR